MQEFIARHHEKVAGTLSGFDRVVFRGTLRKIAYVDGMHSYLRANDVLLKDFSGHVNSVTKRVRVASLVEAKNAGRPIRYLSSPQVSKEELARTIAEEDGVKEGLVCVLTCVEPCKTFDIHKNAGEQILELVARERKCLFLYHYSIDPIFGFMNARIQTWFPFAIQVCINGREWLGRQMARAGIRSVAAGNCFPWVEDWEQAQSLLTEQLKTDWAGALGRIGKNLNPLHEQIFSKDPVDYYWSTYQSEWAIDVVFQDAAALRRLYPRMVHHGMTNFASGDVMRYLGKRVRLDGKVLGNFAGQVVSTRKERQEGIRIKHTVNGNSVKLYDKAFTELGSVLRAETTIQNGADLRVYRTAEGNPGGEQSWRPLRRGIADLHRRAELSRKSTERYLDAFAAIDDDTTLEELIARSRTPTIWRGKRVRALRPFDQDQPLLAAIARGEFTLTGLRNRDLQPFFFSTPAASPREERKRSAWITRQLRLLRAHGLITKIQGTHRYQLTLTGRRLTTAVLAALHATVRQLTPIAA
jgi:hypothetical protein